MIVGCPACRRQYRLDDGRYRAGAKMRCAGCGHTFEAGAHAIATAPAEDGRTDGAAAGGPVAAVPAARAPAAGATRAMPGTSGAVPFVPFVIVADAGRAFGGTVRSILAQIGCRVAGPEDGTAAFRMAVADRPALMIVSVHLGGLSGVAICEGVKNSPHLKDIKVAIVGSALSADLFNRDTALAYGADLFLEEGMSEEALRAAIAGALRPQAPAGASDGDAGDDIGGVLDDLTAESGAAPPGVGEEIRRLARIMLADLRLYNPERFHEALRTGRLLDVFKDELQRGRAIVDHRFPEVEGRQDLLAAALREGLEREHAAAGAA
jgi:predicted Zn finger-like uncharacterized protein